MPYAPMPYALGPDVHAAMIGGDLVFLDVRADAYQCVPEAGSAIEVAEGTLHIHDPAVAAMLAEAGLISGRGAPAVRRPPPALPSADLLDHLADERFPASVVDILSTLADVAVNYRGRSFASILETARTRTAGRAPGAHLTDELRTIVGAFQRWAPYAPVSGKCLLRSFMLFGLLMRRGHRVDWVFGVRTWPFGAHCWLQAGEIALDDAHDRLTAFTPLLVI